MGLRDIVANAIMLADNLTKDLQATVQHSSFISGSGSGVKKWAPAVARQAIVVRKQQAVKMVSGEMATSQAYVVFVNATVVTLFDKIVLPDGTTGPILNTEGFVDPTTGYPMLTEIYLG